MLVSTATTWKTAAPDQLAGPQKVTTSSVEWLKLTFSSPDSLTTV